MPKKFATYPNEFFDQVRIRLGVANDYQLARAVQIDGSTIKRIREGGLQLSAANLLNIYDHTGWSIEELRSLLYQRIIVRDQWRNITRFFEPELQIKIKPIEETSDVRRAMQRLSRLSNQEPEPFERRQPRADRRIVG